MFVVPSLLMYVPVPLIVCVLPFTSITVAFVAVIVLPAIACVTVDTLPCRLSTAPSSIIIIGDCSPETSLLMIFSPAKTIVPLILYNLSFAVAKVDPVMVSVWFFSVTTACLLFVPLSKRQFCYIGVIDLCIIGICGD